MSYVFVILDKKGRIDIPYILDRMMMEIRFEHSSYSDSLIIQNVGFGCSFSISTPESKNELLPYFDIQSGCYMVADARIDYRTKLIEQLNIRNDRAKELPDSRLILFAYHKWGEKCLEYLFGDFAFVVWDQSQKKLFCARDHFGCRPLYYVDREDYVAVATDPTAFRALPGFVYHINDQFILDAICAIVPNEDVQTFQGVNRLEPAHILTYSSGEGVQLIRYWDLQIQERYMSLSEKEATKLLKDLFIEAVRERSRSLNPMGLELSGGLDSSSIASCMNQIIDDNILVCAFSHSLGDNQLVRPKSYKNEDFYSSKIISFNQVKMHILVNGEDEDGGFPAIINYLDNMKKPAVQSYAMMSDLLFDHSRQAGIKVLLSGFGGDEGVTFHGGGLLEELVVQKDFEKLKKILKERIRKNGGSFYRKLTMLYLNKHIPRLIRILKKDWRKSRFKVFAIDKKLGHKFGMRRRYFNRVQIPSDPDVRKRQYRFIMDPHVSDRLENSYFLAKVKGIEYRYPFLDVKLIEFFYSIPSEYKYKNGIGRYLFRMAMKGILPDEIRLREDRTGATIPNVMYRIIKNEEIFREQINEGRKNNRFHYVDYDKLHWMLDQFKHEEKRKEMNFGPRAFLSPMSVLILQKWQREGKIDIGIKC